MGKGSGAGGARGGGGGGGAASPNGTKLQMGPYKYTKTGPNTWMTFLNGKRVSNRTDADIKRIFSGVK